jgi:L,D-peptidoglycan transpeptidase YkuD (ErfK/YbiS/YcfS/YnhG family)
VDLTLVDDDGRELMMPSEFDDFSERASHHHPDISPEAKKNMEYLTRVMESHGFVPYEHEWWHFDDSDFKSFPLVDVPLERFVELPPALRFLDTEIQKVIFVQENSPGSPQVQLTAWERQSSDWRVVLGPVEATVGKSGIAPPGEKREGDGRTPAGVYHLGTAFGYESSLITGLSYRQATENDFWVDDQESPQYNRWVTGTPQAKSFERMKRDDHLYKYGVVIDYNTNPIVPGKGSAIFMHLWRAPGEATSGCVALAEKDLMTLLAWLDQPSNPVIILNRKSLYQSAQ